MLFLCSKPSSGSHLTQNENWNHYTELQGSTWSESLHLLRNVTPYYSLPSLPTLQSYWPSSVSQTWLKAFHWLLPSPWALFPQISIVWFPHDPLVRPLSPLYLKLQASSSPASIPNPPYSDVFFSFFHRTYCLLTYNYVLSISLHWFVSSVKRWNFVLFFPFQGVISLTW